MKVWPDSDEFWPDTYILDKPAEWMERPSDFDMPEDLVKRYHEAQENFERLNRELDAWVTEAQKVEETEE